MKGPIRQQLDRKNRVRKRRVVRRIYGVKYSWKGHTDRNRHKNRTKRSGQARLVYVKDTNHNVPAAWGRARGEGGLGTELLPKFSYAISSTAVPLTFASKSTPASFILWLTVLKAPTSWLACSLMRLTHPPGWHLPLSLQHWHLTLPPYSHPTHSHLVQSRF